MRRWSEFEDSLLRNSEDMSPRFLLKNGLEGRSVSSIRRRRRKLGIKPPDTEPLTKRIAVCITQSSHDMIVDMIEDGEDGPTVASVIRRALDAYLDDVELFSEKFWRNIERGKEDN